MFTSLLKDGFLAVLLRLLELVRYTHDLSTFCHLLIIKADLMLHFGAHIHQKPNKTPHNSNLKLSLIQLSHFLNEAPVWYLPPTISSIFMAHNWPFVHKGLQPDFQRYPRKPNL
jgi:hypothetical protein